MHLTVMPELEQIIAIAQEAQVRIDDILFIQNQHNTLEAITLCIEGSDECVGYFSWLVAKSNLNIQSVA